MRKNVNLIYLLGAGRSGTTLLATLLNNHDDIETLGEMNQFYEFLEQNKKCSCGDSLKNCSKWRAIINNLDSNVGYKRQFIEREEAHSQIPNLLIRKSIHKKYVNIQEEVFSNIHEHRNSKWYVDSSKYIARYLLLKMSKKIRIKGIYLVRDPRGVVFSFQKKVQTYKNQFNALAYYNIINLFAEIVYRTDSNILKIRYEDLVNKPEETLSKIYSHIFEQKIKAKTLPEFIETPHIVGGNRMKVYKKIKIRRDVDWIRNQSKTQKISCYLFSFPFMLLNNYKAKKA